MLDINEKKFIRRALKQYLVLRLEQDLSISLGYSLMINDYLYKIYDEDKITYNSWNRLQSFLDRIKFSKKLISFRG